MIAYIIVMETDKGSILMAADTDRETIEKQIDRHFKGDNVRIAEIEVTDKRRLIK